MWRYFYSVPFAAVLLTAWLVTKGYDFSKATDMKADRRADAAQARFEAAADLL